MNFQALHLPVSKLNQDDTRHVERSVYCKFMALLFPLAASYGGRGSTYSQDSGSDMGHLWFVVQIGAKWSYKTIVTA